MLGSVIAEQTRTSVTVQVKFLHSPELLVPYNIPMAESEHSAKKRGKHTN